MACMQKTQSTGGTYDYSLHADGTLSAAACDLSLSEAKLASEANWCQSDFSGDLPSDSDVDWGDD